MGVDRWSPEAWVEVLKGWGCGVGGGTVDRPLGEVRVVRYRGERNLITLCCLYYLCPCSNLLVHFLAIFPFPSVSIKLFLASTFEEPVCHVRGAGIPRSRSRYFTFEEPVWHVRGAGMARSRSRYSTFEEPVCSCSRSRYGMFEEPVCHVRGAGISRSRSRYGRRGRQWHW
jgi:hypothetical protein